MTSYDKHILIDAKIHGEHILEDTKKRFNKRITERFEFIHNNYLSLIDDRYYIILKRINEMVNKVIITSKFRTLVIIDYIFSIDISLIDLQIRNMNKEPDSYNELIILDNMIHSIYTNIGLNDYVILDILAKFEALILFVSGIRVYDEDAIFNLNNLTKSASKLS
jgi:hypothetical protein